MGTMRDPMKVTLMDQRRVQMMAW
jgi:hypothetical protein